MICLFFSDFSSKVEEAQEAVPDTPKSKGQQQQKKNVQKKKNKRR